MEPITTKKMSDEEIKQKTNQLKLLGAAVFVLAVIKIFEFPVKKGAVEGVITDILSDINNS